MARTVLALQEIKAAGLAPALGAANAGGHSVPCGANNFIVVKNASAAPINATLQTPAKFLGVDVADVVVAVPAGGERWIGPLLPALYSQSDGYAYVDLSAVATVTIGAFTH